MSLDTPIHEIVRELFEHGIKPAEIAYKLDMKRGEIAILIKGKVPYSVYKAFVSWRKRAPLEAFQAKYGMSRKDWYNNFYGPKCSLETFRKRTRDESVDPLEAIKPHDPTSATSLRAIYRRHPNPTVSETSFRARVRQGMSIEEALTRRNQKQNSPRIDGKGVTVWYNQWPDPVVCYDTFRDRLKEGMDPVKAITMPSRSGSARPQTRRSKGFFQELHAAWVASGKQIVYKRVLARVAAGEPIETAVLRLRKPPKEK